MQASTLPKTRKRELTRKLTISEDDPFGKIFNAKEIEKELMPPKSKSCTKQ